MNKSYSMRDLLEAMVARNATDLHLSVGIPPRIRVSQELVALDLPKLGPSDIMRL